MNRDSYVDDGRRWWLADKGEVHKRQLTYVQAIDRFQSVLYNKFVRLEALYDTNPRTNTYERPMPLLADPLGMVQENVIASNVDTVTAAVASRGVRARFMTDDGDWSTQRTARHLEWYAEALAKLLGIEEKCQYGFKHAAIKGTGVNYVFVDKFNEIHVEPIMVDDIVVDELEVRGNKAPRQIHIRAPIDRETLKAEFPKYEAEIDRAQTGAGGNWRLWAGYRPIERNEVVLVRSWMLPIGTPGEKGYVPGRECWCIDGCDLRDRKWEKPFFPLAIFRWQTPVRGWYGISLAERIAGIQRALNRRNWQIERSLDQNAVPTTYVNIADAALAVKTTNRIGTIAVYKSEPPKTVTPQAVSAETYKSREDLKAAAFEESGVSRMSAAAAKPAGLDSGIALREYRDQTTQRFAMQERGYEQFYLDTVWLVLDCCKDLGKAAPTMMRKTKFGSKKIPWSTVDMRDVRVQIAAASTIARTPAGRTQAVIEWAQAGIISQDDARRLLEHPDLERAMSLYTEALENIERCIEEIADGAVLMPEPYQNLKMLVWRGQMYYLEWGDDGAPEQILENLRQYIVQAAYFVGQSDPANQNAQQPGAAPGALPGPPGAGGPPMLPAGPPMGGPPQAAFSPQAMQLMAR